MKSGFEVNQQDFMKIGGVIGTGLIFGNPTLWAQEESKTTIFCLFLYSLRRIILQVHTTRHGSVFYP